jgi:hypothetical protein
MADLHELVANVKDEDTRKALEELVKQFEEFKEEVSVRFFGLAKWEKLRPGAPKM